MNINKNNNIVHKNYYSTDSGQDIIPKQSNAMSGANKNIIKDENKPFIDRKQTNMKNEQFAHHDLYFDDI